MTISNRQLFLKHVGQTSSNSLQLEVERAEGIYFYTPGGQRYIDLVSGVSVSNLGHGHSVIKEAVKAQLDKHMHLMVYGEFVQSPQTNYASWLCDHLPGKFDNVYFVNSGSEAIEGAMKLAKRYTGRHEIIGFKKGYHGSTHGALSLTGDTKLQSGFLPLLPGIKHIRFNNTEDLGEITGEIAAVVVEPIQAEAGIIEPENGFLKKLQDLCSKYGTLLIFDEVQTGFGRTGKLFGFENYDVVPDIICFAKGFGGGMPLGAFVAKKDVMQTLTENPALGHITTFGGHPLSCAAGLAAQQFLVENKLPDHAVKMGNLYRSLIQHEGILEIRGKGLFLAVVFNDRVNGNKLMNNLFNNGLIVDRFLFCNDAFRIAPPLIISEEEVKLSVGKILKSIGDAIK